MLTSAERAELRRAKTLLERDNLLVRMGAVVGRSVDALAAPALRALPAQAREAVSAALERGLSVAFDTAARTVRRSGIGWVDRLARARWINMAAVAASGAGGGLAGLPGVIAELPFTTTILMRAIAQVATEEGEDLADLQVKVECLNVFALGSPGREGADLDYFALRVGFARALGGAAGRTLDQVLPQAVTAAAARLNVPVAYKIAAETVPLLGAAAGAAVNLVFADHFQGKARGHFIVRRLERVHGEAAIRRAYEAIG